MAQSHREASRRLFEIAEQQQGFFTTKLSLWATKGVEVQPAMVFNRTVRAARSH